jgi:hypothetical protein
MDPETLNWIEHLLTTRFDYILNPAHQVDEPEMIRRRDFGAVASRLENDDSDDEDDDEIDTGSFCSNCHRLEQRTRFAPVASLMKQYPWRSCPEILAIIDLTVRGRCHYLTTPTELIDHLLELIYRRVLAQQNEARWKISQLPYRQFLYAPGMPGASRSLSRTQYEQNQVPAPANTLPLAELRQRVRRLANRLDAVDAAKIVLMYGDKYGLGLKSETRERKTD